MKLIKIKEYYITTKGFFSEKEIMKFRIRYINPFFISNIKEHSKEGFYLLQMTNGDLFIIDKKTLLEFVDSL